MRDAQCTNANECQNAGRCSDEDMLTNWNVGPGHPVPEYGTTRKFAKILTVEIGGIRNDQFFLIHCKRNSQKLKVFVNFFCSGSEKTGRYE